MPAADGRVRPTVCAAAQHACQLARLTGWRGGCCAGLPVTAGQHHATDSLPRCAYDSGSNAQRFSSSEATGQARWQPASPLPIAGATAPAAARCRYWFWSAAR